MLTNAGRDMIASQVANTSTQAAACNYGALTADATAPSATDTTLSGELAAAGGGLSRKQLAYAHTAGQATFTLSGTFTANGNDVVPVIVAKAGFFNAASVGTMGFETKPASTATITVSGDAVSLVDTFTLS